MGKEIPMPLTVGLTGNMGCGKSTVLALLSKYPKITLIDSDTVAKGFTLSSDPRTRNIVRGMLRLEENGEALDPKLVAKIMFGNPSVKARIEAVARFLVRDKIRETKRSARGDAIIVVESALLFESLLSAEVDTCIVATCPCDVQLARLRARGMDDDEIEERLSSQWGQDAKIMASDERIDTACSLGELNDRVSVLYTRLLSAAKAKQWVDSFESTR